MDICIYLIGTFIAIILGQYILREDVKDDLIISLDYIMLVILGFMSWIAVLVLLVVLLINEIIDNK